jgi:hypothetical protein
MGYKDDVVDQYPYLTYADEPGATVDDAGGGGGGGAKVEMTVIGNQETQIFNVIDLISGESVEFEASSDSTFPIEVGKFVEFENDPSAITANTHDGSFLPVLGNAAGFIMPSCNGVEVSFTI